MNTLFSHLKKILLPNIGQATDSRRDEWVQTQLKALPKGIRLLDAGAGEGRFKPFCNHLKYVGQDFAEYTGGGAHGTNPTTWDTSKLDIVSDITDIPEKNASFDAILCTEVLEHVPDPLAALREFSRLAKPGAKLLLTTPFISGTHFAPYHFCTGFSWHFYEHHLPQMGWKIDKMDIVGDYYDTLAQELQRLPSMAKPTSGYLTYLAYPFIIPLLHLIKIYQTQQDPNNHFLPSNVFLVATRKAK